MIIVIIIVLLLLMVGGGGAGFYFFVWRPRQEKEGGKKEEKKPAVPPTYFILPTLSVPVWRNNRVDHYYFLKVQLAVPPEFLTEVTPLTLLRIQDSFVEAVNDRAWLMGPDYQDTIEALKARLLAAAQKVEGGEHIEDVTVTLIFRPPL